MLILLIILWGLVGCSSPNASKTGDDGKEESMQHELPEAIPMPTHGDSICELCDAASAVAPVSTANGGYGNITTYGSVTNPTPSEGGACNYGKTNVYLFAAAHVHLQPSDLQGIWDDGRICGQCVQVNTLTPIGIRSTIVRIMDKCPDAACGIDLGGAPAQTLMGQKPGRYSGSWEYVACNEGGARQESLYDGAPSVFVKEGSNAWWALVQVRNAPGATTSVQYSRVDNKATGQLQWATEAEKFLESPAGYFVGHACLYIYFCFHFW
jgi:expansin (peptidoglycan-binding protein)